MSTPGWTYHLYLPGVYQQEAGGVVCIKVLRQSGSSDKALFVKVMMAMGIKMKMTLVAKKTSVVKTKMIMLVFKMKMTLNVKKTLIDCWQGDLGCEDNLR